MPCGPDSQELPRRENRHDRENSRHDIGASRDPCDRVRVDRMDREQQPRRQRSDFRHRRAGCRRDPTSAASTGAHCPALPRDGVEDSPRQQKWPLKGASVSGTFAEYF